METTEGPNVKARPIVYNLPPDPGIINFASGSFVHRHEYDRLRESAMSQIKQQAEVISTPINWEKIAKERGEENVALRIELQKMVEMRTDFEVVKALVRNIEPWASHHACNNRHVSGMVNQVYLDCVEIRRMVK